MRLSEIAEHLNCNISPDAGERKIAYISSFEDADENSITFLSNPKYKKMVQSCHAAAVIVKKGEPIDGKINLAVDNPYLGYAKVAQLFEDDTPLFGRKIDQTAVIDSASDIHTSVCIGPNTVMGKQCSISENTVIGANCVIENKSIIGSDCHIDSGVIIRRETVIGNSVIIQSGTVIGSEGFGNAMEDGKFVRIPCFGNVVIEDDVEIGANVTVDRGNFKPTIIRKGARIDNLVQIAHNVDVGENSAMAAQVGISGSTKVGKGVLLGGQAGLAEHLEIGDGALIGAKAGLSKNVLPGQKVTGYPARDFMKMRRIEATQLHLPDMRKELKALRKEIEELKNKQKNNR